MKCDSTYSFSNLVYIWFFMICVEGCQPEAETENLNMKTLNSEKKKSKINLVVHCILCCDLGLLSRVGQILSQKKPDNLTVNNVCLNVAITNSCNRYEQGAAPASSTVEKWPELESWRLLVMVWCLVLSYVLVSRPSEACTAKGAQHNQALCSWCSSTKPQVPKQS